MSSTKRRVAAYLAVTLIFLSCCILPLGSLLFTAGDAMLIFCVENHSGQVLFVDDFPWRTQRERFMREPMGEQVEPCSVSWQNPGKSRRIRVMDGAENVIYEGQIPRFLPWRKATRIVVPADGAGSCGPLGADEFMLEVENRTEYPVLVLLSNVELGTVQGRTTVTLGPLPGTFETVWGKVRATGPEPMMTLYGYNYAIAPVPTFQVSIVVHPDP